MPNRLSRRMVLLAAYEDFTRRESVCLQDGDFDLLLKLKEKKAAVIAQLVSLEPVLDEVEKKDFKCRVDLLLQQEERNAQRLAEKMKDNRQELRMLSQNAVSANKLRRAYASPTDRPASPGSLKGKA